ncbi:MAG: hypothetical protein IPN40_00485 [Uliginosibacterium sp.]|nr:hypothetical protein [Uliginosibacterium sp.]
MFANLTLYEQTTPLLRLRQNATHRIWEWLSKERPVGGDKCAKIGSGEENCTGTLTDYTVRVKVCVSGVLDGVCTKYSGGGYKPTGLLQKYGENESMHFGLLTGSYANNKSGGVLRKNVGIFTDEIDTGTGQFKLQADNDAAIVNAINRLKITGFKSDLSYECGWITDKPLPNGTCQMWGNPVGEMMYEAVRYFAGASATTNYLTSQNAGEESTLKLPVASWKDPYKDKSQGGGGAKYCAKPFMLTISDIYPSYDSDELPNVNSNFGTGTAKDVSGFSSIRGLAPEEPTKEGSYYSAGVARWARINDVNAVKGEQKVQTFVVAMASPLPKVKIPIGASSAITVIPFAKSVDGYGVDKTQGKFQPTNQLVDFYIDEIKNTDSSNKDTSVNGGRPYYKFRINYEDVEQGADHDMDAIVTYTVKLNLDKTVTVSLSSDYRGRYRAAHGLYRLRLYRRWRLPRGTR